ncbi:sensor histidine kinase [Micromonospora sediminimaris]|uniref:sensor histidine kinase n=1 Tax=Micromonospora sediminimaris TaxID=547162 RepID=UPI0037ACF3B9
MNRLPLRRGLLVGMVLLTTVALLAAGVVSTLALRAYLLARTDDELSAAAALARQRFEVLSGVPGGAFHAVVTPTDYLVEIRQQDGTLTRLGSAPPAEPLLDRAPEPPGDGRTGPPTTLADGAWRAVTLRVGNAEVLIALPLAPVRETVGRLVLLQVTGGAVVLFLLAGFARAVLVRGLRPLDRITDTATAIAAGDLGRRVPVDPERARHPRTEVDRLTLAVNGMLGRLQSAIAARIRSERQVRDFMANASHELRTPLTSIRGYLHLLRHDMVGPERRTDVLRRSDEEATRMSRLLDDLLYLARLEAEPQLRRDTVDLTVVARESVADLLAGQPDRPVALRCAPRAQVTGDEDALRQVMANLLANVRAHTAPTDQVTVEVTPLGDHVQVRVSDTGPGVDPALGERAFDRFSRAGTGSGSGLGLAIVTEIVAAHDGEVGLGPASGDGGTVVWFRLPTADS